MSSRFKEKFDNKNINICGNTWTIRVVPTNDTKMVANESNGLCESYERTIYISDLSASDDIKAYNNIELFMCKVLCHEIIHAVFFEMCQCEYYDDEKLTEVLAHAMPKFCKIMLDTGLQEAYIRRKI